MFLLHLWLETIVLLGLSPLEALCRCWITLWTPRLLSSFSVCYSFSIWFGWNHKPLPSLVKKNNRRNCCSRILNLVIDQFYRSHVHPVWSSTLRLASHYPVYTWCSSRLGIINRKEIIPRHFSPTFAVFHPCRPLQTHRAHSLSSCWKQSLVERW